MPYKPLNKNIIPVHYSLQFLPDFVNTENPSFTGHVSVTLQVSAPVSKIVLHQQGLNISRVTIQCAHKKIPLSQKAVHYNKDKQTVSINFGQAISPGTTILSMNFSGKCGAGEGLYRSTYKGKEGQAYLLTTQMEPAFARQAFPCVDDPAAKATFGASVIIDEGFDALSNTLPLKERKLGNGKKEVIFASTPQMATYLFYLGVGKFEYLKDKYKNVLIRVVTTSGKAQQGTFALDAAKKFLGFYETYFGIPYPLSKLDLIAVPDFAMGAMENWGAIAYRETSLLYNEKTSSFAEKQRVAEVVSHELVHQWFGNLATMSWWNDLWLNESFADFMAHKAIAAFFPELEPWSQFLQDSQSAYALDALKSSHSINVDVKTPEEIDEIFDAISYQKGGMVLRMLEAFLGKEIFRKGLHCYLSKFSYKNAEGKDLWRALEDVSGKPVGKMMDSWLNRTGYPVVAVSKDKGVYQLSQKRFLYAGSVQGTWIIPLSIMTDKETSFSVMNETKMSLNLRKHTWIKINAGETGFYRVKYAQEILQDLGEIIKTKNIGPIDRWGIHNDASALCTATEMPLQAYFHLLASYKNEDDYLVLMDIARSLEKFFLLAYGEKWYPRVADAARETYKDILANLGWESRPGEKRTDMQIRAAVLAGLGMLNDPLAKEKTQEMFQTFLKDKTAVHPDMRGAMYAQAAWHGTEKTYDLLLALHRKEESQAEKNRLLRALASFQDKKLLIRTLDMMFHDKDVKMQDAYIIPLTLSSHPIGKYLVWPWLQKHWKIVTKHYVGAFVSHMASTIKSLSTIADVEKGKQIKQFLEKKENHINGTERAIANMLEMMEINDQFLRSARKELSSP